MLSQYEVLLPRGHRCSYDQSYNQSDDQSHDQSDDQSYDQSNDQSYNQSHDQSHIFTDHFTRTNDQSYYRTDDVACSDTKSDDIANKQSNKGNSFRYASNIRQV